MPKINHLPSVLKNPITLTYNSFNEELDLSGLDMDRSKFLTEMDEISEFSSTSKSNANANEINSKINDNLNKNKNINIKETKLLNIENEPKNPNNPSLSKIEDEDVVISN